MINNCGTVHCSFHTAFEPKYTLNTIKFLLNGQTSQYIHVTYFLFKTILIDTLKCLGGPEVKHQNALLEVPGSLPGFDKDFYVFFLFYDAECYFLGVTPPPFFDDILQSLLQRYFN